MPNGVLDVIENISIELSTSPYDYEGLLEARTDMITKVRFCG